MQKKLIKGELLVELTDEHKEVAINIKGLLSKTAKTIIEIGSMMNEALKSHKRNRGYKEAFYNEIGISARSAQRYMQIARHEKVKELEKNNNLEGKTLTDLIELISPDGKPKSGSTDTNKVAQGFYSKYKNEPNTLKEIIDKLQSLMKDNNI